VKPHPGTEGHTETDAETETDYAADNAPRSRRRENDQRIVSRNDQCSICVLTSSKDLSVSFWFSPGAQIECVERNAEQIGGNKTELRGTETDDTNDCAVDGGENPTLPAALA
jgi:hypothetical protein